MLAVKAYRYLKERRKGAQPEASNDSDATQVQEDGKSRTPDERPSPRPESTLRWKVMLLIALVIPVFLETLDYTVVATAQTNIASAFRRLDLQGYIGTAYLLSSTVFLPIFASIADLYGRHLGLQLSFFFFVIGSAISTGAQSMVMMIVGRGVAGIGAAGMLTIVRVILADSASLDDNTWQTSMLFLLYAVAYSVGPVIGGALVSVSFRWVFAINIPCCVAASLLCFFLLRNKVKKGQASQRLPPGPDGKLSWFATISLIDWVGAFLFISAGILVLLGLNWGSNERWNSAKVIACLVIGVSLFIACIAWEYVLELQQENPSPSSPTALRVDPMIPLAVFRSYDICTVQYTSFVSGMVMLVMFYFIAIFMTIATGYSATRAGVQLVYFAPGMGVGTGIAIFLIKRLRQPKYPIILGGAIISISLGVIVIAMNKRLQILVNVFLAVAGAGTGLQLGPLAIHARFSLPADRVAVVTALSLFFRSFGGTIGLAQCAAVLSAKVKAGIISLILTGALSAAELTELSNAEKSGALYSLQGINSLSPDLRDLIRDSYRKAVTWCFISLIPWSGISFFLTLFLTKIEDSDRSKQGSAAVVDQEKAAMNSKVEGNAKEAPAIDNSTTL